MSTLVSVHKKSRSLEVNEPALGYFEGYMENLRGFLVTTDTRLMFIKGGSDDHIKTLDIEYDKLGEISWNANNVLYITPKNSKSRKKIELIDAPLELLEILLKSCVDPETPVDDHWAYDHHILKED